jgi:putative oxidoreductase
VHAPSSGAEQEPFMSTIASATSLPTAGARPGRGLHIALWIAQGLLALAFLGAGMMKLVTPIEELAKGMSFIAHSGPALVRFIGLSEAAGALGLILPAATRIKPGLTPLAALGLTVVMALVLVTHLVLGEYGGAGAPIVLGGLAAFVAWGRWKKAPIAPRG